MNQSQTILVGGLGALVLSSAMALSQSRSTSWMTLPVQSGALVPLPLLTESQASPSPAAQPIAPAVQASPLPSSAPIAPTRLPELTDSPSSPQPTVTQGSVAIDPNYQAHRITTCSGNPASANFREVPSLAPAAVLGAVKQGEIVYLTGRRIQSEGVIWYEAIAPSLFPVPEPSAQNHSEPNQAGWIASCFMGG